MPEFPHHYLRFRDPDGVPTRRMNDFLSLKARLSVNGKDRLTVRLSGEHAVLGELEDRCQVELWRRDPRYGLDWHRFFSGLYRKRQQAKVEVARATLSFPGDKSLLARRVVAWPADTNNRSSFVSDPAETIMKLLVQYNLTSDATEANGRIEAGENWPAGLISVETDGGRGDTRDWYCAHDNLLETLQGLALVGGGDFDLVKADLNTDPLGWEFRFYEGQLGTDRSASLTFAVGRGNMAEPDYELDWEDEATVAIVGGPGEGADRTFRVRTGTNYGANNHIEFFVGATDAKTNAGLDAAGDRKLAEREARERFTFKLLQTPKCVLGLHWNLGDLAKAVNPFTGMASTVKINAVNLVLQEDGAQVISGEAATP